MSTRGTIVFVDNGVELVRLYNHCDSYPSGLGKDIAEWLSSKRIGNGIGCDADANFANGTGCLVAQFIRDFKKDVGGLYVVPTDFGCENYNYRIEIDYDDLATRSCNEVVTIEVTKNDNENPIFKGNVNEFIDWIERGE